MTLKCKLVIKDEVNCKIEGLDLSTRKTLINRYKMDIPGARYLPAVRLGRWDGKASFFQLSGATYINLLPDILQFLVDQGFDIELDDQRDYKVDFQFDEIQEDTFAKLGKVWPKGHPAEGKPVVIRDYQVSIINNFLTNQQCLQEIATGAGKCQPLDSKVLTPSGWTTMAQISPGDSVVTPTGNTVTVLNTFHPGIKDVYEVTFSDGRTARACADHIWKVYNIDWKKNGESPWQHLTTSELISLKSQPTRSIGIPLVTMENDTTPADLPIAPWLLGFLLGNGIFRTAGLTFSTSDAEIVEKVRTKLTGEFTVEHFGACDYAIEFADNDVKNRAHGNNMVNSPHDVEVQHARSSNQYIAALTELGLFGLDDSDKFIPDIYFSGSLDQRLELIRGLVDSNGTIDNGSVTFCSVSDRLATGFQQLIRSVGGIARLRHCNNQSNVHDGIRAQCKDSFCVATTYPSPCDLVSLPRKKDAIGSSCQHNKTLTLNIESITKVSTEEVKCIYIDDPAHLYVTDDYVVTHNTLMTAALSQCVEQYGRSLVIVPNKDLVKQTEADYRNLGLDVGVYFGDRKEYNKKHTICTWQSLNNMLKKTKSGEADVEIGDFIEGVVCVIVDECFHGDTKVLTPSGYVPIRDIRTGDEVINFSETTGEFKVDTVVKQHVNLFNSSDQKMYELEFDNGAKIKVTGNHKFLTTRGWVRADDLTETDEIISKT